ncbi:OmpH family outer membrane protein [Flavobacterium sp. 5]|uniref:OmpH family outer membrane protein n=1 Tax=Flavobacterium sp. 5 TaxID=2035199 RepID=UPI000C2BEDF8|nr:OmpH family outer membrane protein [Flavobacterium sp. 5]PKB18337.1 periplasmic chaperone for outer membrane proteins Skp [Flavobacterium sp. 5]
MKATPNSILFIIYSLLISLILFYLYIRVESSNNKIAYVDNIKLFDNFKMTKELERSGKKEFNSKKSNLNSLYIKLQSSEISIQEKKILMQEFVQKKEDFEQFNQIFASQQSAKIWIRIKSYSLDFAKENKYNLIIGSDNKTNILFADDEIDVTTDLLTYINKKYEGLK